MTGTLSAFTASTGNTVNTTAAGTLSMQEVDGAGTVTCNSTDAGSISTNAATCSTINKYGGSTRMVPGTPVTTTISIKNTGNGRGKHVYPDPAACTQSNNGTPNGTATDFCAQLTVVIKSGATTIYSGTAAALGTGGVLTIPAGVTTPAPGGATVSFTFTTTLAGTAGNTYRAWAHPRA